MEQEERRTTNGGRPYNEQMACARRFDKAVDFGSPISAWTPEMLKIAALKWASVPVDASQG